MTIPPLKPGRLLTVTTHHTQSIGKRALEYKIHQQQNHGEPGGNKIKDVIHSR